MQFVSLILVYDIESEDPIGCEESEEDDLSEELG
jgi:hypothetical protein